MPGRPCSGFRHAAGHEARIYAYACRVEVVRRDARIDRRRERLPASGSCLLHHGSNTFRIEVRNGRRIEVTGFYGRSKAIYEALSTGFSAFR